MNVAISFKGPARVSGFFVDSYLGGISHSEVSPTTKKPSKRESIETSITNASKRYSTGSNLKSEPHLSEKSALTLGKIGQTAKEIPKRSLKSSQISQSLIQAQISNGKSKERTQCQVKENPVLRKSGTLMPQKFQGAESTLTSRLQTISPSLTNRFLNTSRKEEKTLKSRNGSPGSFKKAKTENFEGALATPSSHLRGHMRYKSTNGTSAETKWKQPGPLPDKTRASPGSLRTKKT